MLLYLWKGAIMKTKIALLAAVCLIATAAFAKYTYDTGKKQAGTGASGLGDSSGQQTSGSFSNSKGSQGTGAGGSSAKSSVTNPNNMAATGDGKTPLDPDSPCASGNDDGNGGCLAGVGTNNGSPQLSDGKGCNDANDAFMKANNAVLSAVSSQLVMPSCDWGNNCTQDFVKDTGKILKVSVGTILSTPVSPWTTPLTKAWLIVKNLFQQYSTDPDKVYACAANGDQSFVAGSDYRHPTWFRHTQSRVYLKRCCPNARCTNGYFDFKLRFCIAGTRPKSS